MILIQGKYYKDKALALFEKVFSSDQHKRLLFENLKVNSKASERRGGDIQIHNLEYGNDCVPRILISSIGELDEELYDRKPNDIIRFFEKPFKYDDRYYYLSGEWSGETGASGDHHIDDFIKIVNEICGSNYQFHREEKNSSQRRDSEGAESKEVSMPLNQILYGPPGTGKTYHTVNHALGAIYDVSPALGEKDFTSLVKNKAEMLIDKYNINEPTNRKLLTAIYNKLIEEGQIVFTTFHQSYGYEEFIEGIKPKNTSDSQIKYEIALGVFKKLCEKAILKADISPTIKISNDTSIWKMSLGRAGSTKATAIRKFCFDNNLVCMGFWVTDHKFAGSDANEIWVEMQKLSKEHPEKYPVGSQNNKKESATKTHRFINEMKKDDIVLISGDNLQTISGVARVIGNYKTLSEVDVEAPSELEGYEQCQEVEWLVKNVEINIADLLEDKAKQLGIGAIISANNVDLNKLKNYQFKSNTDKEFVLIIDEINRGNISKIFGELITLIEEDKRIGGNEETRVSLPYSGKEFDDGKGFGVPQNLHIIGTMNTADRSIALMDTALRRRFEFVEMMPKPSLLEKSVPVEIKVEKKEGDSEQQEIKTININLEALLSVINQRITYLYDRDHQIGHAYLLGVETKPQLDNAFRNKIIPLLQEYFYDDWEKIQLVLGDHPKQMKENDSNDGISDNCFIKSKSQSAKSVFGVSVNDLEDKTNEFFINFKEGKGFSPKAYLKITNVFKE